jgi:hypothetical protein
MAQHDFNIANQGFPAFRSDLNNALSAAASLSSGTSAPSTTFAYQLWYDTTADILKIRNGDDDAWIDIFTFNQTADTVDLNINGIAVANTDTDTTNTGNVTLDFSANQNFVLTLTGNVTLDNPTTETVGQSGFIVFIQDASGNRTVSLGTDYETAGGAGLTLSTAASTTDIVPYVVAASGRILLGTPQLAFA